MERRSLKTLISLQIAHIGVQHNLFFYILNNQILIFKNKSCQRKVYGND